MAAGRSLQHALTSVRADLCKGICSDAGGTVTQTKRVLMQASIAPSQRSGALEAMWFYQRPSAFNLACRLGITWKPRRRNQTTTTRIN